MPAKDYQLMIAAFGTVYIGKQSKSNKNTMTNDRIEVPKSHFIQHIMQWTDAMLDEGETEL